MSGTFPIAYVAGSFPLRSETFVWREVRELRRRGWTVHTFGLRPPEEQTPDELADLRRETRYLYGDVSSLDFLWGGRRRLLDLRLRTRGLWQRDAICPGEPTPIRERLKLPVQMQAGIALAEMLHDLRVRHVHAHFAHAPTTVAMYAGRYLDIPFSVTGHANDLFQRRQLLKRKLQRASFVASISEWHRDWYHSIHPEGNYPVIRCGVPVEAYGPPPEPLPGRLRVLSVARLVEKKGLDLLIRAVNGLPEVELSIAGDGPQLRHLQVLAAPAGGTIRFLGPVDPSAVADQLRQHDAFALPCRPTSSGDRDGIPIALMEAMAGGLPVISGDLPAIRELIEPQRSGILVASEQGPMRSIEQIREALASLSDDLLWRRQLGGAGQQRVREEFGLELNIDRLERALRESAAR